ncbi:unnamed protein product [Phaeothamnion confervicola]
MPPRAAAATVRRQCAGAYRTGGAAAAVGAVAADASSRWAAAVKKHMSVLLIVTFLIKNSVFTVVFQTFACDSMDEFDASYLRTDYSISCKTAEHALWELDECVPRLCLTGSLVFTMLGSLGRARQRLTELASGIHSADCFKRCHGDNDAGALLHRGGQGGRNGARGAVVVLARGAVMWQPGPLRRGGGKS